MNSEKWRKQNTESLRGKTIAVTGSTGGLGGELCAYLAELGATLILLDRNAERSAAHARRLRESFGADVTCVRLDLEDLFSAEAAVEILLERQIDVFIHNAGAYSIPRHACACGYDNVFTINFAAPYYMIRRLMPMLRARRGRVVAVGSIAHNYSTIDRQDVDFSTRKAASKVYGNAKRYLMFALHALFRDETEASLAVTHPGITFTNITAHYPKLIFALIKHPMKVIFMRPRKAALSILAGVFSPTPYGTWIGPRIVDIWGLPKQRKLHTCRTEERESIARIAEAVYARCADTITRS